MPFSSISSIEYFTSAPFVTSPLYRQSAYRLGSRRISLGCVSLTSNLAWPLMFDRGFTPLSEPIQMFGNSNHMGKSATPSTTRTASLCRLGWSIFDLPVCATHVWRARKQNGKQKMSTAIHFVVPSFSRKRTLANLLFSPSPSTTPAPAPTPASPPPAIPTPALAPPPSGMLPARPERPPQRPPSCFCLAHPEWLP